MSELVLPMVVRIERADPPPRIDALEAAARGVLLMLTGYRPVPVDDWPPELSRLQVGGTNLDQPTEPAAVPAGTPLVLLSPHVELSTGKAMAQAAHAAQLGWRDIGRARRRRWREAGLPIAVREATPADWESAISRGAPVVHDGGFTEVAPGTATALFTVAAARR